MKKTILLLIAISLVSPAPLLADGKEKKQGVSRKFTSFILGIIKKSNKGSNRAKKRAVVMGVRGLNDEEKVKKVDVEPNEALLAKVEKGIVGAINSGIFSLSRFVKSKGKAKKKKRSTVMGIRGLKDTSSSNLDNVEPDYDQLANTSITGMFPTPPKTPNATKNQSDAEIEKEVSQGRAIAAKMLAFGHMDNKTLNMYLNLAGIKLATASGFPNRFLFITALNTNMVNAFAAPGGYIFITKGALAKMKSEDELMAVLAHEAGHAFKGHLIADTRTHFNKKNEIKPGSPYAVKRRIASLPEHKSGKASTVAKFIGSNTGSILFNQFVNAAYDVLLSEGMSKKFEHEADRYAVDLMARLGYNSVAYVHYLNRIAKNNKPGSVSKTHPPLKSRINQIKKRIKQTTKRAKFAQKSHYGLLSKNEFNQLWTEVF